MSAADAENAALFGLIAGIIMGLFQLITKMGMRSKCLGFDLDLRSRETKQMEIEKLHELKLKRLSLEERKIALREKEIESKYSAVVEPATTQQQ
jgi:hypothetical protein